METGNASSYVGIMIRATSNVRHISKLPTEFTTPICESAVMMRLAETGAKLLAESLCRNFLPKEFFTQGTHR
jgi:hypothetical protein